MEGTGMIKFGELTDKQKKDFEDEINLQPEKTYKPDEMTTFFEDAEPEEVAPYLMVNGNKED